MDEDFELETALWKQQKVEKVELKTLKYLDQDFNRSIGRRNWIEWIACAFVVACIVPALFSELHIVAKIGGVAICLAVFHIAAHLWRYGRARQAHDPTMNTSDYIAHYRQNLLGQVQLLRRFPFWYIAPVFAGWTITWIGVLLHRLEKGEPIVSWIIYLVAACAIFMWMAWYNRVRATKLEQRAIELAE